MANFPVIHIPTFVRMLREAQGVSQKELADQIGISQSAIAQYERGESALSREKLLRLAPLLNINPKFIETGIGNPFKEKLPEEIIRLALPNSMGDQVDLTLIKHILDYNQMARFLLFKPSSFPSVDTIRIRRWQRKGLTVFIVSILDSDGNIFMIQRKNNVFFHEHELVQLIQQQKQEEKKEFDVQFREIAEDEYDKLQLHTEKSAPITMSGSEALAMFAKYTQQNDLLYLKGLIDKISSYEPNAETESKRMKEKLEMMDPEFIKITSEHIMRKILPILKQHI